MNVLLKSCTFVRSELSCDKEIFASVPKIIPSSKSDVGICEIDQHLHHCVIGMYPSHILQQPSFM